MEGGGRHPAALDPDAGPAQPTEVLRAEDEIEPAAERVAVDEKRSCAAGARVAARLGQHGRPVRAVVRGPAPGGVDADEVARALGLPLLVAMRPEPGLARALERGEAPPRPRGPLAGAARAVLAEMRAASGARS